MLGTPPSTPPLPKRWGDVDTPETPLGAYIRPNPSPHLRKEMLKWINTFPEKTRRNSTVSIMLNKFLLVFYAIVMVSAAFRAKETIMG